MNIGTIKLERRSLRTCGHRVSLKSYHVELINLERINLDGRDPMAIWP